MIKSIVSKTIVFVLFALLSVALIIGWYVYDSQTSIIDELQTNQKTYIVQKLALIEKSQIENELKHLYNLSYAIKGALSNALINADNQSVEETLKYILENDNIKAIKIFDTNENEIFLTGFKRDGQIEFSDYLSTYFKTFKSIKIDLTEDDEAIGYLQLYYDNSIIINNIKELKLKDLKDFDEKAIRIQNIISQKLTMQAISVMLGVIIIIVIIIILLRQLVNKPLVEFQKGLKSFFDYLEKPSRKVEKINIDTQDEFGQMTKSVNESIQISMKMHGEMAQLMMAMDKNVITSETDEKGIITHVSKAFCDISGYTKEELIGQPHNIVRHPDMPKEIFKELWQTLKNNQTWEGEVKNLRKDGTFYWVHTIISPKCTRAGGSCGYTAIRYNITDKKEVEDLTDNLEIKIEERTLDLEKSKKEVEAIHKHTRDAIEYASLIQSAVLPDNNDMRKYFSDQFVIWHPKDIVGGDIYFFEELRHEDECLLFFIDCTGHGVPGAFVTMLVKAVEQQIVAHIMNDETNMEISPAWIMGYFNRELKKLLKQETKDSISNAGWDGGIIYYNRREQILKFAGAETPLFYMTKDGEFKTIKGNRYSVGYKKCAMDYEYKETILEVEEGMKFYCTTDGYLDQNGGAKDFPFGKKRFGNIIKENYKEPMAEIQEVFLYEMFEWEEQIKNNDRNDDMTIIGFEIGAESFFFEMEIEEIVKYEGVMTQNVIASCMDNIEVKITNMGIMGIVSTITIEYCQNMMNYSKNEEPGNRDIVPAGTIEVQYIDNQYYDIVATNIVSVDDKEKIEPKLIEIQGLDKAGIKKRYRELRKSGKNTHEKGGGIGMYEIAKVSDSIEYHFTKINDDKYSFTMKSVVTPKVREK